MRRSASRRTSWPASPRSSASASATCRSTHHADALAGRIAALAAGDAARIPSVRRHLRAGRAVGRLHPADGVALLAALERLKTAGNSLFVVEHDLDLIRQADWIVDVGPDAGDRGSVLYSGPPDGLAGTCRARRRAGTSSAEPRIDAPRKRRMPAGWLRLAGSTRNNLREIDAAFPLGCLTTVTGVSGSGKSSLVSQALPELVARAARP